MSPIKAVGVTLACLSLVGCASLPGEPLSRADWARQGVYTGVLMADWAQTRYIAKHLDEWHEMNPALGRAPSIGRVNIYFGATVLVNAAITRALPAKYRPVWQYSSIGFEAFVVGRNAYIGIGMQF